MAEPRDRLRKALEGLLGDPPAPLPWHEVESRLERARASRRRLPPPWRGMLLVLIALVVLGTAAVALVSANAGRSTSATTQVVTATTGAVVFGSTSPETTTPSPSTTSLPLSYCVVDTAADDTLNIRSGPGIEYERIGGLAHDATGIRGTGLEALDSDGRPWREIEFAAGAGWVAAWYLAPEPCPAQTTSIATTSTSVVSATTSTIARCAGQATLTFSADNFLRLFVDGDVVAERVDSNDWRVPIVVDALLVAGSEITVEAMNEVGSAGVVGMIEWRDMTLVTDHSWEVSALGAFGPWAPVPWAVPYGSEPWGDQVPGIGPDSYWLWDESPGAGETLWFRLVIPPC